MRVSRFTAVMIAMAAVAVALLVFLAAALYLPGHSTKTSRTTFDLPGTLPTSEMNATNPLGCGTNHTDYLSFPARTWLFYTVAVNASGDTVIYELGGGPGTSVGFGDPSRGDFQLGSQAQTLDFVFQGCGDSGPVPYSFWGNFTLGGSG